MRRASEAPLITIGFALAVGLLWLAVEMAVVVAAIPGISIAELADRLLRLLPWHLLVFAGFGVALAAVARVRPLDRAAQLWTLLGMATFSFLGARLVEGLMRTGGPRAAAVGVVATALGVGAAATAVAGAARLLPAGRRWRWHVAAGLAWTVLFVAFLDRAGYEIGRASTRFEPAALLALFQPRDALLAALPLGAWLVGAGRHHIVSSLAGLGLLAAPFCAPFAMSAPERAARPARSPAPDVFLIVLDTFRADHLGRVGGGQSITPRLDALAAESVVFPNAFAPSNWTRGSMPGLIASLPYAVVGHAPGADVATFATELQRAGFHTAGASANPLVSARLGWAHGYDEFVDPNEMGDLLVAHPLQLLGAAATAPAYRVRAATNAMYFRDATEMRRRALGLLDGLPRPAFLHVQTMDTHGPYLPPHDWLPNEFDFGNVSSYYTFMQLRGTGVIGTEAFRPRLENFRARYAASARYVDAEVGALLDGLRERGRYDEALIWVVSDHGEAFGEHDVAGHTGLDLPNELLRVPMLVKLPRSWGVAPRRDASPVSTYSLLPTTLSLLGLPPLPHAFGADLAGLVRGETTATAPDVLFCDSVRGHTSIHAVIRWPWKLVALRHPDGTTEVRGLYDLERGFEDLDSRAAEEPQRVAALLDDLHGFRARVAALKPSSREDPAIDAATEEQLRKLGYIE